MKDTFASVAFVAWMAGIVLAKGFWPTLLAVCVPLYGGYLVVERVLQAVGWV